MTMLNNHYMPAAEKVGIAPINPDKGYRIGIPLAPDGLQPGYFKSLEQVLTMWLASLPADAEGTVELRVIWKRGNEVASA